MLPSRYLEVPRHGYLELLREAAGKRGGRAPEWLQNMIIYELSYYISPEDGAWVATACHGEVADEFVALMRQIRAELDDDVIRGVQHPAAAGRTGDRSCSTRSATSPGTRRTS